MKIGVFDSGIGGMSVATAIERAMPDAQVVFRNDHFHVPYGTRNIEEIYGFVLPILANLQEDDCDIIVIACNTVTTNLIDRLRGQLSIPLIGMEPMIKPASTLSKSGVIAICATPRTLSSPRYAALKSMYASDLTVLEPDCSDWSSLIERTEMTETHIRRAVEPALEVGADVIVLGCTHYHWIEADIKQIAGDRAVVLQPEEAVITQLRRMLT